MIEHIEEQSYQEINESPERISRYSSILKTKDEGNKLTKLEMRKTVRPTTHSK